MLGSDYEDESELTSDDRKKLEEIYQLTVATTSGMVDRHNRGVDMQATIDRIITHVYGIYFYAFAVNGMIDTQNYVWVLGDTEHCVDCLAQASMGEQPGSYWKKQALAGIYPRSPSLFCTGLHCQCEIVEV